MNMRLSTMNFIVAVLFLMASGLQFAAGGNIPGVLFLIAGILFAFVGFRHRQSKV